MVYEDMTQRVPVQFVGNDFYKYFPFSKSSHNKLYLFFQRLFDILISLIGILIGILFVPFIIIGNFIEPKWLGNSMNISPLLSILSLMFWGLIWGTTGMIVSVPFTVVIIIILSEIDSTRPLAILLSEKGNINEKEIA